ncbi:transmembrane and coiled-coil domains protein 1-like isoform X1 [Thunnus albacares]|uniref:transmembrane and coiled-coil domains protein 1-like isoform X1 n=2 Tax=Thunnus albacares TaxID=8236 RepID=UPI001CF67233|nr:transmembrane and coiled-coil domains protein 1-like isoform X1 [Thunnus albacares]
MASLIHNDFSSAGNISALKDSLDETQGDEGVGPGGMRTLETGQLQSSPNYASDDCSSATSVYASSCTTGSPGALSCSRDNALDCAQASGVYALLHEIQELKDNQVQLEESFENLKSYYQQNYTVIMETLQKEQNRCDLIEQQLSDLTELHQNEIGNFYKKLADMEENIAHQSYFRVADIDEALQACQTHLFKLEQEQQQKVVQPESLQNTTARTLLGKFINVLLAVLAVLLLVVSTVANCVAPFMKTYCRMFSTLLFVALFFLWWHWDASSEYLHHFLLHMTS